MTPDQARVLAQHVAHTWADEPVDGWYATLLQLDADIATAVLGRCKARYTGRKLPLATFRNEYGPGWPTDPSTPGPCDTCSSTGVLDIDDHGLEQHCSCGHGTARATAVVHPSLVDDRFRLTPAERQHGLAQVAALRQLIATKRSPT